MPNRLAKEKSLYLQQHRDNPVHWYPWGKQAFDKAKKENKPIFLSIGYSSCHWCHVMAHDCFEDNEAAEALNTSFIAIKVDKEEYPDIDTFYMEFLVKSQGSGGWPLDVFINPNKVPFFGFTYLPKQQFMGLLNHIASAYAKDIKLQQAELQPLFVLKGIVNAKTYLQKIKISKPHGPQFPTALLSLYALEKGLDIEFSNLTTKGLFDHIEGGWFRYTVDPTWKIPHFEKMLYDQATLLYLCAEVYKKLKDKRAVYAIEKTIDWLQTYMKLPTGLYGSATDADTKDGEGYYYSIEEAKDTKKLFRLNNCGVHEGRFIPWINFDHYQKNKKESEAIISKYKKLKEKLDKPELDKKSVMAWNCFLAFALLRCADALKDKKIKNMASRLFDAITKNHVKTRYHHVVYGKTGFKSQEYLSDYAAYLLLLSELMKTKPELQKNFAKTLQKIKTKFIDKDILRHTTEPLFDNISLWQDSPVPSGGSMLVHALLNAESDDVKNIIPLVTGIAPFASKNPYFFAYWLSALNTYYMQRS